MARSRLLARMKGRRAVLHEEDGKGWIEHTQDAEPIVDLAAAMRDGPRGKDDSALGIRVAIIPRSDLDRAFIEGWANDPDGWRRWYEANPAYRTTNLKSI